MNRFARLLFLWLAAASTMSCGSDGSAASAALGDVGAIGFALRFPDGVEVNTLTFKLTGPNNYLREGALPVTGTGQSFGALISAVPAGRGYELSVQASVPDVISCSGQARFDVNAGTTTTVSLRLSCTKRRDVGSVLLNGDINYCAVIESAVATVSDDGTSIKLSAEAFDEDEVPGPLQYEWTTSSGTIANADSADATYLCTAAGEVTFSIKVNDGECGDEAVVSADCVAPPKRCEPPLPEAEGDSLGDPHLRTLDAVRYDLQAVGELTLLRSADGSMEVQTRTAPWNGSQIVAVNVAVGLRVGSHRVSFYVGAPTRIDDEPVELLDGEPRELAGGGSLTVCDGVTYVVWPDGSVARITRAASYLGVQLRLTQAHAGQVSGLLGNFDGQTAGELVTRTGEVLKTPASYARFFGVYVESWRIRQQDSLFTYAPGEDTETFTDRSFPRAIAGLDSLTPEQREAATSACQAVAADWQEACVVDIGLTGDASFAGQLQLAPAAPTALEILAPEIDCAERVCANGNARRVDSCAGTSTLLMTCSAMAPCIAGFCTGAQDAAVRGLVHASNDNHALAGALVTIKRDGELLTALLTNTRGYFSLELDPGTYTFMFSAADHISEQQDVVISAGEVKQLPTLRLAPKGTQPGSLQGAVSDAQSGAPILGATLELRRGVQVTVGDAVTVTAATGMYELRDLAPGNYTLVVSAPGYHPSTTVVVVEPGATATEPLTLSKKLLEGDLRIVLTWSKGPRDLDAHLFTPTREVYYGAHGAQTSDPFATLDLDDGTLPGLETVTIWTKVSGVYRYRVHNYSNDASIVTSEARVSVYDADGLLEQYEVPSMGSGRTWDVFELNGATGELTAVNNLSR